MASDPPKANARAKRILVVMSAYLVAFGYFRFVSCQHALDQDQCKCKKLEETNFRIVNGTAGPALKEALPWMAFFYVVTLVGFNVRCSATVIGRSYVITAKHCVEHLPIEDLGIGAGLDHDINRIMRTPANFRKVKRVHGVKLEEKFVENGTYHNTTKYNTTKHELQIQDLALLELEEPWEFDKQTRISPACLLDFERNRSFDGEFLAAGYGITEMRNWTEPKSEHLSEKRRMNLINPLAASEPNQKKLLTTKLRLFNSTEHLIVANSSHSSICFGNCKVHFLLLCFYF